MDLLREAFAKSPTWHVERSAILKQRVMSSKVAAIWKPKVTLNSVYGKNKSYNVKDSPYLNDIKDQGVRRTVAWYAGSRDSPFFQLDLTMEQLLFAGGRIPVSLAAMRSAESAVNYRLESKEQEFVLKVTQAYAKAVIARQNVSILEKSVSRLRTELKAAKIRFVQGVVPRTDMDMVNAMLSGARAKLIDGRNKLQNAILKFTNLTGFQPGQDLNLDNLANASVLKNMPNSYVRVLEVADRENPGLLAAKAFVKFSDSMVTFRRGALLPNLGLQLKGKYGSPIPGARKSYGYSFGLRLQIPIFNSGLSWVDYRVAQADSSKAAAELVQVVNSIQTNAQVYFQQAEAARNKLDSYEFVEQANYEVYQQATTAYQTGLMNITDLLSWEEKWRKAQLDTVKAYKDYILSRLLLKAIMGKMTAKALFGKDIGMEGADGNRAARGETSPSEG